MSDDSDNSQPIEECIQAVERMFSPVPVSWTEVEQDFPRLSKSEAREFIAGRVKDSQKRLWYTTLFALHPGLEQTLLHEATGADSDLIAASSDPSVAREHVTPALPVRSRSLSGLVIAAVISASLLVACLAYLVLGRAGMPAVHLAELQTTNDRTQSAAQRGSLHCHVANPQVSEPGFVTLVFVNEDGTTEIRPRPGESPYLIGADESRWLGPFRPQQQRRHVLVVITPAPRDELIRNAVRNTDQVNVKALRQSIAAALRGPGWVAFADTQVQSPASPNDGDANSSGN